MSILEQINQQITDSMKSGDQFTLDALRMAKTALTNAKIAKPDHHLTESDEIEVLQREHKKRGESAVLYAGGGRTELAQKEEREAAILKQFLPAEASDDDIAVAAKEAIAAANATTIQDLGKVMGIAMGKLHGKTDGSRVSAVVRQLLQ